MRAARAQESKGYRAALEMVYDAIKLRSTDIHMEPTKEEMAVRFRIDGILQPAEPFPRTTGDSILNSDWSGGRTPSCAASCVVCDSVAGSMGSSNQMSSAVLSARSSTGGPSGR